LIQHPNRRDGRRRRGYNDWCRAANKQTYGNYYEKSVQSNVSQPNLAIFYLPADQIKKPSFKTSAGIFLRQIN
jgi:hypothetical protein